MRRGLTLAAVLAVLAVPLAGQAANAELVVVNSLDDQTGWGFGLGYTVSLDKFPDPLLILPKGRFVRVSLPAGTYRVQGLGFWDIGLGRYLHGLPGTSGVELVLKPGQPTVLPFLLQSRQILIDAKKGSYRPEIYPIPLTEGDCQALAAEYAAAVQKGSPDVLGPLPASSLFVSRKAAPPAGGPRLAQDDVSFADFAARRGLAFPERYQRDDGEALFPELTVGSSRRVTLGGYLPRTGVVQINWNGEAAAQVDNGNYQNDALVHVFSGQVPVVRVSLVWRPQEGDPVEQVRFIRFDGTTLSPTRVERKLADGTRVVVEDSLVQVISPTAAQDYAAGRFGAQSMPAAVAELFRDEFDFLYVAPGTAADLGASGEAQKLFNDTQGVGLPLFASPVSQRLRSLIRLSARDSFTQGWSLMAHELMHSWGNYVLATDDGGHWGNSTAAGKLGGFEPDTLVSLGNGRYQAHALNTYHDWWLPFSPLELYLLGLAPASEVPPVKIFSGIQVIEEHRSYVPGDFVVFTADQVKTVTMADIVKANGPRVPAYGQAPTRFRALCVLLTDNELSPDETAEVRASLAVFADPLPLTFGRGNEIWYNFAAATGGRGTFQVDGLLKALRPVPPPAQPASVAKGTGELVFANLIDNQVGGDLWLGFLVQLEGLSQPLLVRPEGRFVRVALAPGTYTLKGIGLWQLADRKFLSWFPGVGATAFTVRVGEQLVFPWELQSRIVNLGNGRYRPEVLPAALDPKQAAAVARELQAAMASSRLSPAAGARALAPPAP